VRKERKELQRHVFTVFLRVLGALRGSSVVFFTARSLRSLKNAKSAKNCKGMSFLAEGQPSPFFFAFLATLAVHLLFFSPPARCAHSSAQRAQRTAKACLFWPKANPARFSSRSWRP